MVAASESTNCECLDLQPRCPKSPLDLLCTISGLCYDTEFYWEGVCAPEA